MSFSIYFRFSSGVLNRRYHRIFVFPNLITKLSVQDKVVKGKKILTSKFFSIPHVPSEIHSTIRHRPKTERGKTKGITVDKYCVYENRKRGRGTVLSGSLIGSLLRQLICDYD